MFLPWQSVSSYYCRYQSSSHSPPHRNFGLFFFLVFGKRFINFKRSFVWSFKSSTRVIKWRRFANVTAVWNWWNKPIYICFFKMFFIKNVSLKRFYKYKNCCNRPQFLNKETVMKCLGVKIFAWNFLQLPIQNMYLKLYA